MRILGIDPGLTRCGVAVVEVEVNRSAKLVHVSVVRTDPGLATHFRLGQIGAGIEEAIVTYDPEIVAVERVFFQDNLQSVTSTMQAMGVAMYCAAQHRKPLAIHTPSEVKAAVTGSGRANKAQVQEMVRRVLGLEKVINPPDASDAIAIALCQGWRGTGIAGAHSDSVIDVSLSGRITARTVMTPAQQAWSQAQAQARRTGAVDPRRRMKKR